MRKSSSHKSGFTLIEMAIVLVIIGLIVGGVLVGQDLIRATGVRATITQIQKYEQAVNAFRDKYGGLPGDLSAVQAAAFGFVARGQFAGEGDGNGVIEGANANSAGANRGVYESMGETVVFWVDLSTAGMVDGSFTRASETSLPSAALTPSSSPSLDTYFPPAKLGGGNYIYVWSGGVTNRSTDVPITPGLNFYGIAVLTKIYGGSSIPPTPGLTVQQAYDIDTKIDDGLPQYGNVTAIYNYLSNGLWAAGQ